jgi:hypothetical protein
MFTMQYAGKHAGAKLICCIVNIDPPTVCYSLEQLLIYIFVKESNFPFPF